jgi:glutathione synthase
MNQKHLFIIDHLENLNLKLDSTVRMAFCLDKKGCDVYFSFPDELKWEKEALSPVMAVYKCIFDSSPKDFNLSQPIFMNIENFYGVYLRKDPPFDNNYLSLTWLLDSLPQVHNKPRALRQFNEKLSISFFPEFCDKWLVTQKTEDIYDFCLKFCSGDAIVKPLHFHGGQGVFRLKLDDPQTQVIFERDKKQQFYIVQPFNADIFNGEIRAFTLAGIPIAWCLKKPAPNEFLANTSKGATCHPYHPTEEIYEMAKKIASTLFSQGILFSGLDIIGNKISEINITSPRLLSLDPDDLSYYNQIAEYLIR